jgi:predicted ATPase
MIERLLAENFGCLKHVETPRMGAMHAFIGPNDSGKSTILRAVRAITYCASNALDQSVVEYLFNPPGVPEPVLRADSPVGSYEVRWSKGFILDRSADGTQHTGAPRFPINVGAAQRRWGLPPRIGKHHQAELRAARLFRFDPDALRKRSTLIPDGGEVTFVDERGSGLPGIYDTIVNRGDDSFAQIRERVIKLFPAIRALRLRTVSQSEKVLEIELRDGTRVPADRMSEGLLYFLAFAALPYLARTSIVLVEEPENGLHPARIGDVMRALREFANSGTQILIATHSPLVVNELTADEVSVVTRDPETGTKITLIKDTPNFEERSKVYALGELWVSYANGDDEAPLLKGSPAA